VPGADHLSDATAGRLARLGAAPDAQQILGLREVATDLFERALALHHAEPGALAQLLHQARGDLRHVSLLPTFNT
jgi:hypothetical protein